MKILSDNTDLILIDDESGRFFRVNKVSYTPEVHSISSYNYDRLKSSNDKNSDEQNSSSNNNRPIESYEAGYIFYIEDGVKREIVLCGRIIYTNKK